MEPCSLLEERAERNGSGKDRQWPATWETQEAWLERALCAVPEAIRQLSTEERRVIIGHFFEERSLEVLAEELGLGLYHVHSILETALRHLRRAL